MRTLLLAAGVALLGVSPAAAKVDQVNERGFVIRLAVEVPATPDATWRELIAPKGWWNGDQSYSGDPANLSLDPRPGGCFCEVLPAAPGSAPKTPPRGGVEHMRVVYAERPRALRMVGALGPLQAEALTGTLTVQLAPVEGQGAGVAAAGTRILWEYVVGGYMRPQPQAIATAVDVMLTKQLAGLAEKLGAHKAEPVAGAPPSDAVPEPAPSTDAPATPPTDPLIGR